MEKTLGKVKSATSSYCKSIDEMSRGTRLMARDIVCGMEVDDQRTTSKREYKGRTYYFCSVACRQHFDEDPACYADPRMAQEDATHRLTVQPCDNGPCVR
jgi:YHS domain-containing protein